MAVEHRVGLLMRFRAHDVGDAQPLLVAVLGFDDAQHDHAGAGAQRAAAGEVDGAVAFRRIVDDHQELRRVAGLVASALDAHGALNLARRSAVVQAGRRPQQIVTGG